MWIAALVLLGLVAVAAWLAALVALLRVVGMAPAGQRMSTLFNLGWLRLDRVIAAAGQGAALPARNYRRALITFLVAVILIAVVSMLMIMVERDAQQGVAALLLLPALRIKPETRR